MTESDEPKPAPPQTRGKYPHIVTFKRNGKTERDIVDEGQPLVARQIVRLASGTELVIDAVTKISDFGVTGEATAHLRPLTGPGR